jgi:hypothetical protein
MQPTAQAVGYRSETEEAPEGRQKTWTELRAEELGRHLRLEASPGSRCEKSDLPHARQPNFVPVLPNAGHNVERQPERPMPILQRHHRRGPLPSGYQK